MKKYGPILKDGFILIVVSTVFVVTVNFLFSGLKKSAAGDDLITAIGQDNLTAVSAELGGSNAAERANRADEMGRTPLMWAAYANYSSEKLTSEADRKRAPIVGALLAAGASISSLDRDGWSALTWAAWSGLTSVVEKLLEAGASVAIQDAVGNTPLMVAAMRGNAEIVRLLLSGGADPDVVRRDGKSATTLSEEGRRANRSREARYNEILGLLGASSG